MLKEVVGHSHMTLLLHGDNLLHPVSNIIRSVLRQGVHVLDLSAFWQTNGLLPGHVHSELVDPTERQLCG